MLLFYAANLFLISTFYAENVEFICKWKKLHSIKPSTYLLGTTEQVFFITKFCLWQSAQTWGREWVSFCIVFWVSSFQTPAFKLAVLSEGFRDFSDCLKTNNRVPGYCLKSVRQLYLPHSSISVKPPLFNPNINKPWHQLLLSRATIKQGFLELLEQVSLTVIFHILFENKHSWLRFLSRILLLQKS